MPHYVGQQVNPSTQGNRLWQHLPAGLTILFVGLMVPDALRVHILPFVRENGPVELLTFAFAAVGGLLAFWVSRKSFQKDGMSLCVAFLFVFAAGLSFVALEEIAWGQTFYHYTTPAYFEEHNAQQEVTIHNLVGLHGASDYLYLVFGIAGLFGAYGFRGERWKSIAVPKSLISLLWTISIGSLFSVAQGNWDFGVVQYGLGRKLAEILELWVALTGFLYVWYSYRQLKS